MTIGQRIKQARKASRMSLRALAEEAGVSAMAISKYERNENTPSSSVVIRLAQSMDVPVDYFFRPIQQNVEVQAFRKHASLGIKEQEAIQARIQEWLERYLEIENLLLFEAPQTELPHFSIHSLEEVERAAQELRQAWDLGMDPIENLTGLLEDRGIKVGQVDVSRRRNDHLVAGKADFDACTFLAGGLPVIVTQANIPGDRQRYDLAHELGHLVLEVPPEINAEKAAHRFAGAFLVPAPSARFELGAAVTGAGRTSLELNELYMLKRKYGLSMQAWVYRARDLGIISESTAKDLFQRFRRNGWHRREPGEQILAEEPIRMQLLVYRALAEDLISRSRAQELSGKPLDETWLAEEFHQDVAAARSGRGYEHLD